MNIIFNKIAVVIGFCELLLLIGCVQKSVIYSKPTIDKNNNWEIYDQCGYEGCYPKVDFLEGEGFEMRIEAFNGTDKRNLLSITIDIMTVRKDLFWIEPSKIFIVYKDNVIYAKPIDCYVDPKNIDKYKSPLFNLKEYYRSSDSIKGCYPINKDSYVKGFNGRTCIILFFDISPPSVEEEYDFFIKGLKKEGKEISVPKITFKPAVRRGGYGKIIDK